MFFRGGTPVFHSRTAIILGGIGQEAIDLRPRNHQRRGGSQRMNDAGVDQTIRPSFRATEQRPELLWAKGYSAAEYGAEISGVSGEDLRGFARHVTKRCMHDETPHLLSCFYIRKRIRNLRKHWRP